jgi:hypothetical protein
MGVLPIYALVDAFEARPPIPERECRPVIIIVGFATLKNCVTPVEKTKKQVFKETVVRLGIIFILIPFDLYKDGDEKTNPLHAFYMVKRLFPPSNVTRSLSEASHIGSLLLSCLQQTGSPHLSSPRLWWTTRSKAT